MHEERKNDKVPFIEVLTLFKWVGKETLVENYVPPQMPDTRPDMRQEHCPSRWYRSAVKIRREAKVKNA